MKKIILLSLLCITVFGCSSIKNKQSKYLTLNGTIEKMGMSTFQYGTHLLKTSDKSYALKSASINLDLHLNKAVTIKGVKVDGYPIEGGPEFIDVKEVD